MNVRRVSAHTVVCDKLDDSSIVFDCGLNRGEFTRWITENFKSRVHGFEPDIKLFPLLPDYVGANYNNVAIAAYTGRLNLRMGGGSDSSIVYENQGYDRVVEIPCVTIEDYMKSKGIARITLLKLDIEGAELEVLEKMSSGILAEIDQITVEFHDFINHGDVPRIKAIISRLEQCGFLVFKVSYFDYSDVVCLNSRVYSMGGVSRMIFLFKYRYLPGVKRFVKRKLSGLGRG